MGARYPADRWAWATFAACLGLLLLLATAMLVPSSPDARAAPHPDYGTLLQGGSGEARHGGLLAVGWGVGVVEILLFVSLMALGARRGASLRGWGRPLLVGGAVYLGIWTALVVSYARYLEDPDPALILGLPEPTAVMLYLLYPMPAVFIVLYAVTFPTRIWTAEDRARFDDLLARRAEGGSTEEPA